MPLEIISAASAVGNLLMGSEGADASREAAGIQSAAADRARGDTMRSMDVARSDLRPFVRGGTAAQNKLLELLGINPASAAKPFNLVQPGAMGPGGRAGPTFNQALINDPEYLQAWYSIFGGEGQGDSTLWDPDDLENAIRQRLPKEYLDKLGGSSVSASTPTGDPSFGILNKPFTIEDFYANKDPGYEWVKSQGMDSMMNKASAVGGVLGGNTLKGLIDYGSGLASTEYGNAFGRWSSMMDRLFSRLSGVSGTGANAAAASANVTMGGQGQLNQLMTGAADAQASGVVGAHNAMQGGFSGAMNSLLMGQVMKGRAPKTMQADPTIFSYRADPANFDSAQI